MLCIADLNYNTAKALADEYGIERVYTDYKDILSDDTIDAISIVTPTFTHRNIVLDAIKANKHILCEKPPALNADETRECVEAAKKSKKLFMYALVCRFRGEVQYLKKYIEDGKMGRVICAEGERLSRLSQSFGWFNSKKKGGGVLIDGAIHELDLMLYLMGYPKPKAVLAMQDKENGDLLTRVKGVGGWKSADTSSYTRDVEDVIKALVTFEGGASIIIRASTVLRTFEDSTRIEINGDRAGARMLPLSQDKKLEMTVINDNYEPECFCPDVTPLVGFEREIAHFVECCNGKAECICNPDEAIRLMEIIDAIYKSAETGIPVIM